jgi:hypothetical protein
MAPEPVEDRRPYSASDFVTVYKIPIEFAMLEIINSIILKRNAPFPFMLPHQGTFEKGEIHLCTPNKDSERAAGG